MITVSTQYITTTTYTGASRSMSATAVVSQSTPTPTANEFVLVIQNVDAADRRKIHNKRQSGSTFVSANGSMTSDCSSSPTYLLSNGVLTATVSNTVYVYSTEPGVPWAVFAPTTISGSINTTFQLSGNGVLTWFSSNFNNGILTPMTPFSGWRVSWLATFV